MPVAEKPAHAADAPRTVAADVAVEPESRFVPQSAATSSRSLLVGIVLALSIAYVLAQVVGFWPYYVDDAYIGFRCVENFLAGAGFFFNPGQRVEAVTNIGWLLTLVPLATFLPVTVAGKLMGATGLLVAVVLSVRIARRCVGHGVPAWALAPLPLLIVAQPDFVYFSLAGMETGLLAAGLAVLVTLGVDGQRPLVTAGVGAVLFTVHPEAVAVYPLALLLQCGARWQRWRRNAAGVVVFGGSVAAITLGRWLYFGDVLPNTFYAKPGSITGAINGGLRFLAGNNTNIAWPFATVLVLPLLLAGLAWMRRESRAAAAHVSATVLVGLGFAAYSGADWTGMGRYFAPYVPLAMIPLWLGIVGLCQLVVGANWKPAGPAGVAVTALLIVGVGALQMGEMRRDSFVRTYPGYVMSAMPLQQPVAWMRDALPDDAVVATRRIGLVGYGTGRHVFDYKFGLPERGVARKIRARGEFFENPRNPDLADDWRRVQPDYLLEDAPVIDVIIADAGGTREAFEVHGTIYRVCREFELGPEATWVLCERADVGTWEGGNGGTGSAQRRWWPLLGRVGCR